MSYEKTIGNDRLGSGGKMKVDLKTYERSTHDLSYLWRSTMAAGTLVPFMSEVALPGDTFDIDLDTDIKTHPTVGPLFGSYKVQLDLFKVPVRLYHSALHNNMLGVGLKMNTVKLPRLNISGKPTPLNVGNIDNLQINPSCLLSYLNIRGVGRNTDTTNKSRFFNAIPYLAYWDIFKNYYANKQETWAYAIHTDPNAQDLSGEAVADYGGGDTQLFSRGFNTTEITIPALQSSPKFTWTISSGGYSQVLIQTDKGVFTLEQLFTTISTGAGTFSAWQPKFKVTILGWDADDWNGADVPKLHPFELENIDKMRTKILTLAPTATLTINHAELEPYSLPMKFQGGAVSSSKRFAQEKGQEALAVKTYQSDLFNNWMKTEWIDGPNGINAITAVDTSTGEFTIDQLQLAKKVYDMLNRIAISGGTYDDWLDAVYTHDRFRAPTTPVYEGGLIKEIVFQEVISNAEAGTGTGTPQPLGTLAGRGIMGKKHKGGRAVIRIDEPCYIMGIASITPRVDYSQGNKWDVNLKTMDDFHKPALDQIGFQDLITDQMAWFDTNITSGEPVFKSAGKQPAWINYMTNVNQVRGNFAIESNEMFMTLNRKYERTTDTGEIKDLTTYIDPRKFNNVFAMTNRDAQNFWVQIAVDITARRKMSAKIMPNL